MLVLASESHGLPPIGLLASSTPWWSHQDSQPGPLLSSSKTLSEPNPPWERGSRQPGPDVSALFTMEKQPLICTEPTSFQEGINPRKGPSERPEVFLIKRVKPEGTGQPHEASSITPSQLHGDCILRPSHPQSLSRWVSWEPSLS